jgi:DNA-binding transcriptional LysR family regulator
VLSPAGQELYDFIRTFFSELDSMTQRLQGGTAQHVRIGASEIVLRDHVQHFVAAVRERFPQLRLTLREGYQPQIEHWLEQGELDLGFTLISERPPAGIQSRVLLELPLALLVRSNSRIRSAAEIFAQDKIEHRLINLPANEAISRNFQAGLAKRRVDWFPSIEVSSLHLIETFVANGHGIGLFLRLPAPWPPRGIRALSLDDFARVSFGALWKGRRSPVADAFLTAAIDKADEVIRNNPWLARDMHQSR